MKQIKALIIRESLYSQKKLVDYLSEWEIQTLEMSDCCNFSKINAFSPQLVFIEKKLYILAETFLDGFLTATRIIILLKPHEKLSLAVELDQYEVLFIPYTRASLFQTIHQALQAGDFDSSKKSFSKQISHIYDELAELFDQVLTIQQTSEPIITIDKPSTSQNLPSPHCEEILRQIKPLVTTLLKESKKKGPLHRYEMQLTLLSLYVNELTLSQSSQDIEVNSITDILKSHPLSQHELKIVSMITSGMTSEEIAEQLFISPQTVKCHRRNIRKKLNLVGTNYSLVEYIRELTKL